jgi:hypothetical protein
VGSKPHLELQCVEFPGCEFACGAHSTGGLRPLLLALSQRPSAGMMTTVALHKRAFTRAAGVSPPWCAKTHLQGRYRKLAEDWRRRAGERHCNHGHPTTGADADTPPFPWRQELRLQSRSANHGGLTPPAPVLHECTPAGDLAFPLHNRCRSTGGLRPPLWYLVARAFVGNCDFCDTQTQLRQERRASARRGSQVGSKPHPELQCVEFPGCEFACGAHSTGGLRPPLLYCTNARLLGI